MTTTLLQTEKLTKRYGSLTALQPCDLQVDQGEVFGLVGPNGAGKSTLIRVVMGFLRPSDGQATVSGLDCWQQSVAVHKLVSYLPGEVRLFGMMTGRQVLKFFSRIRGCRDSTRALEMAKRLDVDLSRRIAACSSGMRQKVALAAVLSADCPLLILDEPTTHLDPTTRREVLTLVRQARDLGQTVLFSSHIFSEVEDACDRVAMLKHGQLVLQDRVANIRDRHRIHARLTSRPQTVPHHLREMISVVTQSEQEITYEAPGDLAQVLSWLAEQPLQQVRIEPIGLESIYERIHQEDLPSTNAVGFHSAVSENSGQTPGNRPNE